MKKQLSKREVILLVVLGVIIIAMGYWKLILEPTKAEITDIELQIADTQSMVDTNSVIVAKMNKMETEIDEANADGTAVSIPLYDNSIALMVELNDILSETLDYSLDFGTVTTADYLAQRPVTLSFTTASYDEARDIIDELTAGACVGQIGDVSITESDGAVSVSVGVTYFEVVA